MHRLVIPSRTIQKAAILLLSCSIAGCQTNLGLKDPLVGWTGLLQQQSLDAGGGWSINNTASLYIVRPDSDLMNEDLVTGLQNSFARYYPHSRQAQFPESLQQAFISARYAGQDFVVFPRIQEVSAHAGLDQVLRNDIDVAETRRGRVQMDILIFATNGEQLVDQIQLQHRGGLLTGNEPRGMWQALSEYLRDTSQFGGAGS